MSDQKHYCCAVTCPGYPFRASDRAHPCPPGEDTESMRKAFRGLHAKLERIAAEREREKKRGDDLHRIVAETAHEGHKALRRAEAAEKRESEAVAFIEHILEAHYGSKPAAKAEQFLRRRKQVAGQQDDG